MPRPSGLVAITTSFVTCRATPSSKLTACPAFEGVGHSVCHAETSVPAGETLLQRPATTSPSVGLPVRPRTVGSAPRSRGGWCSSKGCWEIRDYRACAAARQRPHGDEKRKCTGVSRSALRGSPRRSRSRRLLLLLLLPADCRRRRLSSLMKMTGSRRRNSARAARSRARLA